MPKIRIISKNALNKSCSALNFVQKIQWAHHSPRSVTKGLQRLLRFKNIILYWEGQVDSLLASTLPKLQTISENGSN